MIGDEASFIEYLRKRLPGETDLELRQAMTDMLTALKEQREVVCAWCGRILKHGKRPVSHGICQKCQQKLKREIPDAGHQVYRTLHQ